MDARNTIPMKAVNSFRVLLNGIISRHGIRKAADLTGLSTGHISNIVSVRYSEMTVQTGQKILKGHKASKLL